MSFAHLKRIHGLGRLRLRGPCGAHDEFIFAATTQKLKKLAKLRTQFWSAPLIKIKVGTILPVTQRPESHEFFNGISPKQKFDETFRLWKADLQRTKQNDCLAGQNRHWLHLRQWLLCIVILVLYGIWTSARGKGRRFHRHWLLKCHYALRNHPERQNLLCRFERRGKALPRTGALLIGKNGLNGREPTDGTSTFRIFGTRPKFYRFHQDEKVLPFAAIEYEARFAVQPAAMSDKGIAVTQTGSAMKSRQATVAA